MFGAEIVPLRGVSRAHGQSLGSNIPNDCEQAGTVALLAPARSSSLERKVCPNGLTRPGAGVQSSPRLPIFQRPGADRPPSCSDSMST